MTTASKKEAKRLYDKFKKEYDRVWREEDTEYSPASSNLDYFWYENRPSSPAVSDEIVKLVSNDSMEMKLVFNNFVYGGFQIPQKRWFLGDENSLDLLPRPASNMPTEFISAITAEGQIKDTITMSLAMVPHYNQNERRYKITNDEISMIMLKKNEEEDDWRYSVQHDNGTFKIKAARPTVHIPSDERKTDHSVAEHNFKGTKISLVDGQLVSTCPVVVYLAERKMNEGIIQWALKAGGAQVLILYNTFFMATGKIQKTNSGFLIKCYELYGSYGTGAFAISPNFQLLLRMSTVSKKSNFEPVPLQLDRLANAIQEMKLRDEPQYTTTMRILQTNILHIMCMDAGILHDMKNNYQSNPVPERHMTEFEIFVHNYHKTKATLEPRTPRDCKHAYGECGQIRKLVAMAKQWLLNKDDLDDVSFAYFVLHVARLFKIYATSITNGNENETSPAFQTRITAPRDWQGNLIDYFPLSIYAHNDETREKDFAWDSLTEDSVYALYVPKFGLERMKKLALDRRPDVILFGGTRMPFPLIFVRAFAEAYEKGQFKEIQRRRAVENGLQNVEIN